MRSDVHTPTVSNRSSLHTSPHSSLGARVQKGYSLIEFSVVVAGLGLLGLLVFSLLQLAGGASSGSGPSSASSKSRLASASALGKIEHSLLGYTLVNNRLPAPDLPESAVAGYTDGVLPAHELGLVANAPILYRVNEQATKPTTVLFNPDPLGMSGGDLKLSTDSNGLDLCLKLIQLQRTGTAQPDGQKLAYGVAQLVAASGSMTTKFDQLAGLPGNVQGAQGNQGSAAVVLQRVMVGLPELNDRLNCLRTMNAVTAAAREALVTKDALSLAQVVKRLRDLDAKRSTQEVANQYWRIMNRGLLLTMAAVNMRLAIYTASNTLVGKVGLGFSIASTTSSMLGTLSVLSYAGSTSLPSALAYEAQADRAKKAAVLYVQAMQGEADLALARAKSLQQQGLLP